MLVTREMLQAARARLRTMRILQVSAELFPLLKTGGLADIAGALPLALAAAGAGRARAAAGLSGHRCRRRATARRWPSCPAPWGERAAPAAWARIATAGAPDIAGLRDRRAGALRPPRQSLRGRRRASPTATTTAASRCSAGPRRGSRRGSTRPGSPRWCTRTTGTPRWRRPTWPSRRPTRPAARAAASSPSTTWPTRACSRPGTSPSSACRAPPSSSTASNTTASSRS